MNIIDSTQSDFDTLFDALLQRGKMDIDGVSATVKAILDDVKQNGDEALLQDIRKFDNWEPNDISEIKISAKSMKEAYDDLDEELSKALHLAYERIFSYHQKQMPKSWLDFEENGSVLGQKVTALDRAGLYIPGGKAAYPSSLLMNAIPAIVAGVKEIVVCTPTPNNEINSLLLAAMHLCGIKEAYKIGGAGAIAAMAYGTGSIAKTDVVTGPGNIYVATAKKLVYGDVNIDMIAGPSEIGIIADESANVDFLAVDLLSQAEHDQMASSLLITTSAQVAKDTLDAIYRELGKLQREDIARESIEKRGAIIIVRDLDEALYYMNKIAPEHLELMVANPFDLLPYIKHAGAIFMGPYTPEPMGDYIAGPNHTLPTGGSARFYSPLNVENFLKRSSIISLSPKGMDELAKACALLAKTEGLDAHQRSVEIRLEK